MGIDSDLIRGHIDTIILKILKENDRYGYEICKEVEEKTNGAYELKQPTLYSCLKRLEDQKLISSYWKDSDIGGRRHYYRLTQKGRNALDKNQEEWLKSRSIIDSLIYSDTLQNEANTVKSEEPNKTIPAQIESKDPLQIENEDPLQIENEDPLQIKNEDPIPLDYDEKLQLAHLSSTTSITDEDDTDSNDESDNEDEDEDVFTITEETENNDIATSNQKTAYDSFFDEDDDEDADDTTEMNQEDQDTAIEDKQNDETTPDTSDKISGDDDEEYLEDAIDSTYEEDAYDTIQPSQNDYIGTHSFGFVDDISAGDEEVESDTSTAENTLFDDEDEKKDLESDTSDVMLTTEDGIQEHITLHDVHTNVEESINNILNDAQNLEIGDIKSEESPMQDISPTTDATELNKDDSNFDVNDYLTQGRSYFNSGTNNKNIHNFLKKREEDRMSADGYDYAQEKATLDEFSHNEYESDESEMRYESNEDTYHEEYTNADDVKNVEFQNDEDKKFTDEILLSFNENNNNYRDEEPEVYEKTSIEPTPIAEPVIEEKDDTEQSVEDEQPKQSPTTPVIKDINSYKQSMSKIGIVVKPYQKAEKAKIESKDYLLINKLRLVRSTISACLVIFLLTFSYIVLSNYKIYTDTFQDTYLYYILGIIGTLIIPGIYGIIYLVNPFKKQTPKYAFRLSMLFGILFFVQTLVIIFSINIMVGFVSFAQVDYNHIQWIVPSILATWFIVSPIMHYYLFTSKKFFV